MLCYKISLFVDYSVFNNITNIVSSCMANSHLLLILFIFFCCKYFHLLLGKRNKRDCITSVLSILQGYLRKLLANLPLLLILHQVSLSNGLVKVMCTVGLISLTDVENLNTVAKSNHSIPLQSILVQGPPEMAPD